MSSRRLEGHPRLVSFSGIDCAGKSTQIGLLAERLIAEGFSPKVTWYRPGYSDELNRVRALVRRMRPEAIPAAGQSAARDRSFARPGVSGAWVSAALVDAMAYYALKIRVYLRRGHVVICDRWIDDALLDFHLRFPQHRALYEPFLRLARQVSPDPGESFLLVIPHAEMLERMRAKNEPFPDTERVRNERFAAYQRMAASGRPVVVDGTLSPQRIHEQIATNVLGRLVA